MSRVITNFLQLPRELKNRGTKMSILNILKVAHDKFTWSVKEIPHIGIMVDALERLVSRILDARSAFPLSTGEG